MDGSSKFYAVKRGRWNKVFEGWRMCEPHVIGFEDALYQGFDTMQKALNYLEVTKNCPRQLAKWELYQTEYFSNKPDIINAYVDGSFKEGHYGGAFIVLDKNIITYERSKTGVNKEAAEQMGSLVGELNAVMLAITYAIQQKAKKLLLYHDSTAIRNLTFSKKEPKHSYEREYVNFVQTQLKNSKLCIDFIKVKAHNGGRNRWNDYVDALAMDARNKKQEISRNVLIVREQIKRITSHINRLDKGKRKQFNKIKHKFLKPKPLDTREYAYLEHCYQLCQTSSEKEKKLKESWELSYELYREGYSLDKIIEKRKISEITAVYHLIRAKMVGKSVALDNVLKKGAVLRNTNDNFLIELMEHGINESKWMDKSRKALRVLSQKIAIGYQTGVLPSVDSLFLKKNGEEEQKRDHEQVQRCLSFLKDHKIGMNPSEKNQANIVYIRAKKQGVTRKEKEQVVSMAKLVKTRYDILARKDLSSHMKSFRLVETGLSAEDVATMRDLKTSTVINHLIKCYAHGETIPLAPYLSQASNYDVILDTIHHEGMGKITTLKQKLPDHVSYDDIKIVAVMNGYHI